MRISDWSSDVCSSDLLGVAPVPIEQRAGLRHRVEGGVGDVGVDCAPDEQPPPAIDVGPAHAPVAQRAVLVTGERVRRLVVVVVEVEDPRVCRHRCPLAAVGLRRSEEHTSELQSLMRISYAVFCLKKKNTPTDAKLIYTPYNTVHTISKHTTNVY